jgi:hypothetical protein
LQTYFLLVPTQRNRTNWQCRNNGTKQTSQEYNTSWKKECDIRNNRLSVSVKKQNFSAMSGKGRKTNEETEKGTALFREGTRTYSEELIRNKTVLQCPKRK